MCVIVFLRCEPFCCFCLHRWSGTLLNNSLTFLLVDVAGTFMPAAVWWNYYVTMVLIAFRLLLFHLAKNLAACTCLFLILTCWPAQRYRRRQGWSCVHPAFHFVFFVQTCLFVRIFAVIVHFLRNEICAQRRSCLARGCDRFRSLFVSFVKHWHLFDRVVCCINLQRANVSRVLCNCVCSTIFACWLCSVHS